MANTLGTMLCQVRHDLVDPSLVEGCYLPTEEVGIIRHGLRCRISTFATWGGLILCSQCASLISVSKLKLNQGPAQQPGPGDRLLADAAILRPRRNMVPINFLKGDDMRLRSSDSHFRLSICARLDEGIHAGQVALQSRSQCSLAGVLPPLI